MIKIVRLLILLLASSALLHAWANKSAPLEQWDLMLFEADPPTPASNLVVN